MNAVTAPAKPKLLEVMAGRLGVEPGAMLQILKNTVIKPQRNGKEATNEEVQAFLIVANKYELNPLTREIFAFESNGAIIPIVSIDGWSTLVNRNENFDGCEFETEHDDKGNVASITCKIYDKRRSRPIAVTEYLSECSRPSNPWRTMPHRMLRHKAFMQAARLAFGLSGIYDEDEARDVVRNDMTPIPVNETPKAGTEALKNRLLPKPQPEPQPEPVVEQAPEEPIVEIVPAEVVEQGSQPQQLEVFIAEARDYTADFQAVKTLKAAADLAQQLTEDDPGAGYEIEQAYLARIAEIRRK
jgi:phage recombination protein Bet